MENDLDSYPLIFAGGPTATSNPEPFADFFDFFALGDGEDLLPEVRAGFRRPHSGEHRVANSQSLGRRVLHNC